MKCQGLSRSKSFPGIVWRRWTTKGNSWHRVYEPLKDVLIILLDSGLRNREVIRMRLEHINWESAFYFNPKGKTRKARRWCR